MTTKHKLFNRNLVMMIVCQGLFLTNNVTFAAINGLVGFSLTPIPWLATLPLMGYVVGGALSTSIVAKTQRRYGRKKSFQFGIVVAILSALLCALAVSLHSFILLITGTVVAGYYNANGQIYRFAAPELAHPSMRDKAVSWVLAGGLMGGIFGPSMTVLTKDALSIPFMGPYLALALIGVVAYLLMAQIHFPDDARTEAPKTSGRPLIDIIKQPLFFVSALGASLGYEVAHGGNAPRDGCLRISVFGCGAGVAMACHRHVRARFFYWFLNKKDRRNSSHVDWVAAESRLRCDRIDGC